MDPVLLARTGTSAPGRAATAWAAREAEMRGAVLRLPDGPVREPGRASVIVCGVSGEADAPPGSGSPWAALVDAARGPVVLVPDLLTTSHRRTGVTLGVDARDPSAAALAFAFQSALLRGVRLHAVHAWALPADAVGRPFGVPEGERAAWEDQEVQSLGDALRPWREKYPEVRVLADVRLFSPTAALLHCSEHAALAVVPGGSGDLAWQEAVRALLRRATCAVAVVPS